MKYIKKILDNGITIVMIPMKNTELISMGVFVGAGSRNDNLHNSGVAHFLDHMMFKGTAHRSSEKLFNEFMEIHKKTNGKKIPIGENANKITINVNYNMTRTY